MKKAGKFFRSLILLVPLLGLNGCPLAPYAYYGVSDYDTVVAYGPGWYGDWWLGSDGYYHRCWYDQAGRCRREEAVRSSQFRPYCGPGALPRGESRRGSYHAGSGPVCYGGPNRGGGGGGGHGGGGRR